MTATINKTAAVGSMNQQEIEAKPRKTNAPFVSIIIPAYNESARIERTLRSIAALLPQFELTTEIIVVNDGSSDQTEKIVDNILPTLHSKYILQTHQIQHMQNLGKGAAVRTGMAAAHGDWILIMDADNAVTIDELPTLLNAARREHSQIVIGSRRMDDSVVQTHWFRSLAGQVFRLGLKTMHMSLARDTQCGFKLYHKSVAAMLVRYSRETGFSFDLEHLAIARQAGLTWTEVGIHWEHQPGSKVNPLFHGIPMLICAQRIHHRVHTLSPEALTGAQNFAIEVT